MNKVVKIELNEIDNYLGKKYDLFLCSSSFEERSFSISSYLGSTSIRNVLIISNSQDNVSVRGNEQKLFSLFKGDKKVVYISMNNPLISADNIDDQFTLIANVGVIQNILIDITTFSHELLLIVIRLIKLRFPNSNLTGIYANAAEYSVGDSVEYKWLTRGIGEPRSVLGYPGEILPTRKNHLIIIVGYEHERAAGLIEAIEPDSIALGFGKTSSATTEKHRNANNHYLHLVEQIAVSYSNSILFEIPCDNPFTASIEIEKQIIKAKDKNVLLAPMNNKITTIGAALAVLKNNRVQMCYAPALSYNFNNYSSPGNYCYIFPI